MFDISALTQVTVMNPRNNYDLRISLKNEKITLSANAVNKMGLTNRGLIMYVSPEGQVILSTQAEEDSVFFKGKEGAETKTNTFTAAALFNELKRLGSETFEVNEVARRDDTVYYEVVPMNQSVSIVDEVEESEEVETEDSFSIV